MRNPRTALFPVEPGAPPNYERAVKEPSCKGGNIAEAVGYSPGGIHRPTEDALDLGKHGPATIGLALTSLV